MSYSVKIICHLAILPERAGFSNMYFIGSILEINKVVWVNIYCLSRRAAQAKVPQVFSSSVDKLFAKIVYYILFSTRLVMFLFALKGDAPEECEREFGFSGT